MSNSLFFSSLILLVAVNGSMATLGLLGGLAGLNAAASRLNRAPESSPVDPWPSAVRIVDFADLPGLLLSSPNLTNPHSSASLWSNIFNLFRDGSMAESIADEMERENIAWFAIPGWNQLNINGTIQPQTVFPGFLVPAKIDVHELDQTRFNLFGHLANLTNQFSGLVNQVMPTVLNPFNLPHLPNSIYQVIATNSQLSPVKPEPVVDSSSKPEVDVTSQPVETSEEKQVRRRLRSILQRSLNLVNNEDTNNDDESGKRVISLVEPVQETGELMAETNRVPLDDEPVTQVPDSIVSDSEIARSSNGLLSQLANLLASSAGNLASSSLQSPITNPILGEGLHEPTNYGSDHKDKNFNAN